MGTARAHRDTAAGARSKMRAGAVHARARGRGGSATDAHRVGEGRVLVGAVPVVPARLSHSDTRMPRDHTRTPRNMPTQTRTPRHAYAGMPAHVLGRRGLLGEHLESLVCVFVCHSPASTLARAQARAQTRTHARRMHSQVHESTNAHDAQSGTHAGRQARTHTHAYTHARSLARANGPLSHPLSGGGGGGAERGKDLIAQHVLTVRLFVTAGNFFSCLSVGS